MFGIQLTYLFIFLNYPTFLKKKCFIRSPYSLTCNWKKRPGVSAQTHTDSKVTQPILFIIKCSIWNSILSADKGEERQHSESRLKGTAAAYQEGLALTPGHKEEETWEKTGRVLKLCEIWRSFLSGQRQLERIGLNLGYKHVGLWWDLEETRGKCRPSISLLGAFFSPVVWWISSSRWWWWWRRW